MKKLKRGITSTLMMAVLAVTMFVTQAGAVDWLAEEDISNMPSTTIRYWYYETPEMTALGKLEKEKFEKLFPNIKVDARTAPPAVDNWELMSFVVGGTNSHIHHSVNNESLWYIDHDMLFPLDRLPGFAEELNRFEPQMTWKWKDGHSYALPWYGATTMLMYNKEIAQEVGLDINNPPEFYDEFLKWAEKLTEKDASGKTVRYAAAIDPREAWWRFIITGYNLYIAATGSGDYISEDGTQVTVADTPLQRKPFEFIYELVEKGYFTNEIYKVNPVYGGLTAINWNFSAETIFDVKRNAPPGFEYFLGPYPRPKESPVERFVGRLFVRELVLMRERFLRGEAGDRVNRAAWEYMKFLEADEQLAGMFKAEGMLPCIKTFETDPLFTAEIEKYGAPLGQLLEARSGAVHMDLNSVKTTEVQGALTLLIVKLQQGVDPAEALAWAVEEGNKILAE